VRGLKAKFLKTGLISIAIRSFGAVLSVLVTVFLARVLGVDGFGAYAYVLAILTLLALPAEAGIPQLVTRETALGMVRKSTARVVGIWRWATTIGVVMGVAIALGLGVVQMAWPGVMGEHADLFFAGLLLPLALALTHIVAAFLRGLRNVVSAQLVGSVTAPLAFIVFICVLLGIDTEITPSSAMGLYFLSTGIALSLGILLFFKVRPWRAVEKIKPAYETKAWMKSLMPLSMITGFRVINAQVDLVLLGILAATMDVGVYKAMLVFSAALLLPQQAINDVISPYLVSSHETGNKHKLETIVFMTALASFVLMLFPALIFLFWGGSIIELVYGEEYKSGYVALVILLAGQVVNAGSGPVALLLNMTGYERYTLRGVGVSTILNVVLNVILIPKYGIAGAAVASALTLVGWNLILVYFVARELGINSSVINSLLFRKMSKI
jgi:O-antigen/teichoic acid export membrane protein